MTEIKIIKTEEFKIDMEKVIKYWLKNILKKNINLNTKTFINNTRK